MCVWGGGVTKWIEVGGEWSAEDCLWLFKHLQNACVLGGGVTKWTEVGGEWSAEDCLWLPVFKHLQNVCVGGGGEGGWLSELKWAGVGLQKTVSDYFKNICKMCVCGGGVTKWIEVGGEWSAEDCRWLFKHLQNACVWWGVTKTIKLKWMGIGLQRTVSGYLNINLQNLCVCVCVWWWGSD